MEGMRCGIVVSLGTLKVLIKSSHIPCYWPFHCHFIFSLPSTSYTTRMAEYLQPNITWLNVTDWPFLGLYCGYIACRQWGVQYKSSSIPAVCLSARIVRTDCPLRMHNALSINTPTAVSLPCIFHRRLAILPAAATKAEWRRGVTTLDLVVSLYYHWYCGTAVSGCKGPWLR